MERATLDAVTPAEVQTIDGWLLPFDDSSLNRAKSAVPIRHHAIDPQDIPRIEAHYAQRGMAAQFRVADVPPLDPLITALQAQGYHPKQPTLVQVGSVAQMRAMCPDSGTATVSSNPVSQWSSLYTAQGFDPVDGANRVQALSRSSTVIYAWVEENGITVAAGTASLSQGWCSIHGMRTLLTHRGKGLAGRILAGLAEVALEKGFSRAFLQVEADNASALRLYERAGFSDAWRYRYWKK